MADETVTLKLSADTSEFRAEMDASAASADALAGNVTSTGEDITAALSGAATATDDLGEANRGAIGWWDDHADAIQATAAVLAGTGVAFEAFARSQADTNEEIARFAVHTGQTVDEVRDLVSTISGADPTFSPQAALAGLDRLRQAGVTTTAELEQLTPPLQDFALATRQDLTSAVDLVDRAAAATGQSVGEMSESLDTFTWLSESAGVNMRNFKQAIRRAADDNAYEDLGMGIDDLAIAMASLEDEGVRYTQQAQRVRRSWRDAEGDLERFYQGLGVSNETLDRNRAALAGATGLTDELAEAHRGVLTPMQHVQARIEDLVFRFGWLADGAGMVAPVLTGAGSVVFGLTQLRGVIPTVTSGLSTLRTRSMNVARAMGPAGLAGAAGVAVIGIALVANEIHNSRQRAEEARRRIGEYADAMKEAGDAAEGAAVQLDRAVQDNDDLRRGLHRTGDTVDDMVEAIHGGEEAWREFTARQVEALVASGDSEGGLLRLILALEHEAVAVLAGEQAYGEYLDVKSDAAERAAEHAEELEREASSMRSAEDALRDLHREMDDFIRSAFGIENTLIRWERGMERLTEHVDENGTSLDITTEAGRRNSEMIQDQVDAINGHIQELMEQGASVEEVEAAHRTMTAQLETTLRQLGFNEKETRRYIDALDAIPTEAYTEIRVGTGAAMAAIGSLRGALGSVQSLGSSVMGAMSLGMGSIPRVFGRAVGGPTLAGEWYVVGEEGPELMQMGSTSGYVHPAHSPLTRAVLGGGRTEFAPASTGFGAAGGVTHVDRSITIQASGIGDREIGRVVRDALVDLDRRGSLTSAP